MPAYRTRRAIEVARGLRAYLNLDVGLSREEAPNYEREFQESRERLREKDREIRRLRKLLADGEKAGNETSPIEPFSLRREFERRGPWVTKFVIGDVEYGGKIDAMRDPRVDQFFRAFPSAGRILELGSLEGGHTFSLASRPHVSRVLGIEGRRESVERARFVQQLLGVTNVGFEPANVESADLSAFGEFDAVFCSGLLYHLPEPWRLIENVAKVSPNLFLWTHYARGDVSEAGGRALKGAENTTVNGFEGWAYKERGLADPLSGMSPSSFWPTLDGLKEMLKKSGFGEIEVIRDNPNNPDGPAVTLAAATS